MYTNVYLLINTIYNFQLKQKKNSIEILINIFTLLLIRQQFTHNLKIREQKQTIN